MDRGLSLSDDVNTIFLHQTTYSDDVHNSALSIFINEELRKHEMRRNFLTKKRALCMLAIELIVG